MTACIECLPAAHPPLHLVEPEERHDESAFVLSVTLRDEDGGEWRSVGGGPTLWEALGFAVASAPAGRSWRPVHWVDLYGD
jgi:hypothetical protein